MELSVYINKPNLRTAKIVTIIASTLQLLTCHLLMDIVGLEWIPQISFVYIVAGLMQIWAYHYLCQYIQNFNLQKTVVATYVVIGCMAATIILPTINSALISHKLYYLISFISTGLLIINIASIAALYIAGIKLFRFQEDVVGGLSLTGKLFTTKATLAVLGVLYYMYYYITIYNSGDNYSSFASASLSAQHLINTLTVVLNICILASIIRIYKNAEEYIMYADYENDSDIINEINDIGSE